MARLSAAVLVATLLSCATETPYKPKGRPIEYDGHFSTFPSGMRLVVYQMPRVDRFVVTATYRAGAADDPRGKEGLAHLVEHLSFRSAPDGPRAPRLADRLAGSGMAFNAMTSHDETSFLEIGKTAELEDALATEAARLRDPLAGVSADDFAIERDVVVAEHRERYENDVEAEQIESLWEIAFRGHPYGRLLGGSPDSLKRITMEDARAFTRERYVAASLVLVVVSPLPARDVARRVMTAFEPFLGDEAKPHTEPIAYTPPALPAPPADAPALEVRRAPVQAPSLWIAWRVPGRYAGREPQTIAATSAVRAVVNHRLAMLVRRLGEAYQVRYVLRDGAGLIVVNVRLQDEKHAQRVLDEVRDGVGEVRLGGWWGSNRRLSERLFMSAYLRLEQLPALEIARHLRATRRPDYVADWQKAVGSQMQVDLDAYGRDFLGKDRAFAVLVTPDHNARVRDVTETPPRARPAYLEPLEDEAPLLPPPPSGRVRSALVPPGLDLAEWRTLPNGLRVVVAKRGTLPVAEVRLAIRTAPEGTPDQPAGLPALAEDAAYTVGGPNPQTVAAIESYRLAPGALVVGERGSSENMDVLLERVGTIGRTLRIGDFRIFEEAKRWHLRELELDEGDPATRIRRSLLEGLFPDHPYGIAPTRAAIDAVSIGDAKRFLERAMRPTQASLVVVSEVAPSPALWKQIEHDFGSWERHDMPEPTTVSDPPLPPGRKIVLLDQPSATQAFVAVAFRAPALLVRDAPAHDALAWLLESRLTRRVRTEEGATYGVDVSTWDWPGAGVLVAATAVEPDVAAGTVKLVLGAAAALATAPPPGPSAARARWKVARDYSFRFDLVRGAAAALEEIALRGLPPDHYESMPASIAALDAARIQAAARSLSVGREVIVIAGDAKVLGPQLRAAGFEPER